MLALTHSGFAFATFAGGLVLGLAAGGGIGAWLHAQIAQKRARRQRKATPLNDRPGEFHLPVTMGEILHTTFSAVGVIAVVLVVVFAIRALLT